ncbi:NAD(P)/FAD-dependent oxidoreductase [Streptomyces sp. NPDC127119]|uniref:NAD(P)/FAD-dependent oxidoreductase n=1 Tax=Streptomyces sp. NPDC127119 TaxID=3345370 RepID=UPI003640A7AE
MPRKTAPKNLRKRTAAAEYDVAVLGAHLTGGLLAAIIARRGVRTVLVDTAEDRARPAGESTVPYTSEVFSLLAERFEVPEIATFAHFTDLPEEVRRASGVKKSLGFLHHDPGREQDARKAIQFNVPGEHTEWHLYRPEADAYACRIAATHGAHIDEDRSPLAKVDLAEDRTALVLENGRTLSARYVVDASGPGSPLLAAAGVGPAESVRTPLRSRLLSAHFTGVRPFESVLPLARYPGATAWSHGSFHHVFDGGWIQVVSFDNHEGARNGLCSVTVSVCPEKFADLPEDPEDAFRALIGRYPSIAGQFVSARTTTPWAHEKQWQWRAERTTGPRWLAIGRAACRAEEVLARDVTVGMEMVHSTAAALLRVVVDPEQEDAEFTRVADFQDHLIDFNDRLQMGLRTAGNHFQLLNAYLRIWLLWQILADLSLKRARLDCEHVPEDSWSAVERFDSELWFRTPEGLPRALRHLFDQMDAVRAGRSTAVGAARGIFSWLRGERFVPPLYRFAEPRDRVYTFTLRRRMLMLLWAKTVAPADFRRLLTQDNVTGRRDDAPPVTAGRAQTEV